MTKPDFRLYSEFTRFRPDEMHSRAEAMAAHMATRRTVREFSDEPVDPAVVNHCLQVAIAAPSGANQQPWTFVVVENRAVRRQLREAAEAEEREFYNGRAPDEWLNAVAPFGGRKTYLTSGGPRDHEPSHFKDCRIMDWRLRHLLTFSDFTNTVSAM